MSSRQIIFTTDAPATIGPYSQAVFAENLLFISGQLAIEPETKNFVAGNIREHTYQCLKNIQAISNAAGSDIKKAVKINIYLIDIQDFDAVNEAYGDFFPEEPPARLVLQVAKLPRNASIEIEAIVSL